MYAFQRDQIIGSARCMPDETVADVLRCIIRREENKTVLVVVKYAVLLNYIKYRPV